MEPKLGDYITYLYHSKEYSGKVISIYAYCEKNTLLLINDQSNLDPRAYIMEMFIYDDVITDMACRYIQNIRDYVEKLVVWIEPKSIVEVDPSQNN
ncbi:MAG: hypothetical protein ACOYLO_00285 [Ferruginibacter sp.]